MTDFSIQIQAGADDGYSLYDGGSFNNSASFVYMGKGSTALILYYAFFRFQGVNIPKGATINSAKIRFIAQATDSGTVVNLDIYGEDQDDATAIANGADLISRTMTSAKIDWNNVSGWTAEGTYDSPSIISIINEIINRDGWESGNSLTIHIRNDGSDTSRYRRPYTYNGSTSKCAELIVNYSALEAVETIALTETHTVALDFSGELDYFQGIAIQESASILFDTLPPLGIDNLTITENFGIDFDSWDPVATDQIAFEEIVGVELFQFTLIPGSYENISIIENILAAMDLAAIDVSESVSIVESSQVVLDIFIDIDESISIGDSISAFNWSAWFAQNKARAIPRYFCTITGAADNTTDIEVKISNFQARKRTDNPTYLSVVLPGFENAQEITDRSNGEIVVSLGYEIAGSIQFLEEILRVAIDDIRTDEGAKNRSITLSGYKTESFQNQLITLEKSIYRSIQSGNILHRFGHIDPYLNPGDTCRIDNDEFVIDYIVYMVNEFQTIMEIREG